MGIGGIGIWQLLIILAIVLLLFGTKRLRNLGGDLGGAIKGFKKAMSDEDKKNLPNQEETNEQPTTTQEKTAESVDKEKTKADSN